MQRLRADGNRLSVRLRGINLSGLEYSRDPVTPAVLDEIAGWGANFLRLPFNQEWLLQDPGYLDQAVADASARGMYVLLDLHWLAHGQRRGSNPDGSNVATPPLPDENSARAWQLLAQRFGGDPAVMFDLLNEPHDRLPDDPVPLVAADGSPLGSRVGAAEWHPWVHRLAAAIRPLAPETPLFVSGTDWGFDLAEIAVPNVVYAAHIYPYPGKRTRADWERALGAVPGPVVVTELGPLDLPRASPSAQPRGSASPRSARLADLSVMEALFDFLDERDLGWAAWSWRDWPALTGPQGVTPWGQLVRERLRR